MPDSAYDDANGPGRNADRESKRIRQETTNPGYKISSRLGRLSSAGHLSQPPIGPSPQNYIRLHERSPELLSGDRETPPGSEACEAIDERSISERT